MKTIQTRIISDSDRKLSRLICTMQNEICLLWQRLNDMRSINYAILKGEDKVTGLQILSGGTL